MKKILIEDTVQGRIIRLSVDTDETVASILDRLRQRYRGLREASLGLVHGEDILEPEQALLTQVASDDEQFLKFELCLLEAGGEEDAEPAIDAAPVEEAVPEPAVAEPAVAADFADEEEISITAPAAPVEAVAAEPALGDLDDWTPPAASSVPDALEGLDAAPSATRGELDDAVDALDLTTPAAPAPPPPAATSPRKTTSKRPPRASLPTEAPAPPIEVPAAAPPPSRPVTSVIPVARNIEPVTNTDQALEALRQGRFAEGAARLLAVRGLIDPKETEGLIQRADTEGRGFLDVLIETHRGLRETVLLSALASTMGCSWISASSLDPTPDALAALEGAAAAALGALPFEVRGGSLVVAVANPLDQRLRADLERLTGRGIIAYMALPSAIARKIKERLGEFDVEARRRAIAVAPPPAPPAAAEEPRDKRLKSAVSPAPERARDTEDFADAPVAMGRSRARAQQEIEPPELEMPAPFVIAPESAIVEAVDVPEPAAIAAPEPEPAEPEPEPAPEPAEVALAPEPEAAPEPELDLLRERAEEAVTEAAGADAEDDDLDDELAPPKLDQISLSDDEGLALYPDADAPISPDGFAVSERDDDARPSAPAETEDVGLKPSERADEFGDRTLLPIELAAAVAEAKALFATDEADRRGEIAPQPMGPRDEPDFEKEPTDEAPIVDEDLVTDFNRTRKLLSKDAAKPATVDTDDLPKLKRERSSRIKLESTRLPVEGDVDAAYQGLASASSSVLGAVAAEAPAAGVTLPPEPEEDGGPSGGGAPGGGAKGGAFGRPAAPAPAKSAPPPPPPVPAPTASVPVAPGTRPASVQAPAQAAPAAPFARRATVHYFARMHPFQNFPLDVAVARHIATQMAGAPRRQVAGAVHAIPAESPRLRLVPCFPGCLCVPPSIDVDVRPEEARARFQVTPLVEGKLDQARLEIYHGIERIETIELPAQVVKTTFARATMVAGVGLPVFSTALELYGVQPKFEGEFGRALKDVLASLNLPTRSFFPGILLVGAALVAVSLVGYWLRRPVRAAPKTKDVQT